MRYLDKENIFQGRFFGEIEERGWANSLYEINFRGLAIEILERMSKLPGPLHRVQIENNLFTPEQAQVFFKGRIQH